MKISIITATYNRPEKLSTIALKSLLNQTDHNFEWVIINDGGNQQTKELVTKSAAPFHIVYEEIEHLSIGFGLCHARNKGLDIATGELIAYLDDDNSFEPEFIAMVKQFFKQQNFIKYSMVVQNRRRDVICQGKTIRMSKTFLSPSNPNCTLDKFISQQEIFDSNGFIHYRNHALKWNPCHRIFADYEFLLQCAKKYGVSTFKVNPQVLVNYIQSSEGTIGTSTYRQWAEELKQIIKSASFYSLESYQVERLQELTRMYNNIANNRAPAFV
ncbi:glycosyltransferase family 2 protein [Nostoc sp. CALU 546]|uniref:glycosyltransferase family 2 protein n=1 Tax=Nostoc sp. CALU 546 TaxID=1867241 RepID=UPI003B670D5D